MELDILGLLHDIGMSSAKQRGDEITAPCPGHEAILGRPDRHASWGINSQTGLHQCFSCGYKGTLESLYLDVVGESPGEDLRNRLILQGISRALGDHDEPEEIEPEEPFHWGDHVPVSNRMLRRRYLSREAADAYGVKYDRDRGGWFMPLYDVRGKLIGGQWKLYDGPLTLPTDVDKSSTVFGLHVAKHFDHVAVVESPLDAVRWFTIGVPAISTFGASVSEEQLRIMNRYWNLIVLCMDDDKAGHVSTEFMEKRLKYMGAPTLRFKYTRRLVDTNGDPAKDPGDVWDDDALMDAWDYTLKYGIRRAS